MPGITTKRLIYTGWLETLNGKGSEKIVITNYTIPFIEEWENAHRICFHISLNLTNLI